MRVDWQHFTPWSALCGGLLIGLAVAVLLLVTGRVAGISGIVAGAWRRTEEARWRWYFLAGLLLSPWILPQLRPVPVAANSPLLLIGAGLLVGFGTRVGGGCTSGHGVCGLSRLSPRSLVATIVFMALGMLAIAWLRSTP